MRFERNFTQLPNVWLRDESLSFRARGLLALLMTHDDGWHVTLKSLAATSPNEGIDALRTATNELEERGYLKRVTLQGRGGKFEGTTWEICDPHDDGEVALFAALDHPTTVGNRVGSSNAHRVGSSNAYKNTSKNTSKSPKGDHIAHLADSGHPCAGEMVTDRHCAFGHIVITSDQEAAS